MVNKVNESLCFCSGMEVCHKAIYDSHSVKLGPSYFSKIRLPIFPIKLVELPFPISFAYSGSQSCFYLNRQAVCSASACYCPVILCIGPKPTV